MDDSLKQHTIFIWVGWVQCSPNKAQPSSPPSNAIYIFGKDIRSLTRHSMRSQESRSSSCAACKLMKRRCTSNCLLAPYFQADEPKKFAKVHKVFGASNVTKILNEVPESQRQDAVDSLVFEAEERLKDPVYGCIGAITSLQDMMFQLQHDLAVAKARLA